MVSAYVQARYPETDEEYETWVYPDMDEDDYVTDEMIQGLLDTYPEEFKGIAASTYYQSGQIKANSDKYANLTVNGATAEYLEYMKLPPSRRRTASPVCMRLTITSKKLPAMKNREWNILI